MIEKDLDKMSVKELENEIVRVEERLRIIKTAKIFTWGMAGGVLLVLFMVLVVGVESFSPSCDGGYDKGYDDGYSDGDLLLSQNSAMCEIEFDGKASGFLKGLFDAANNLPSNATLELTEADGNLELSGKVKFPCGRIEKYLIEEILPLYL